MAKIHFSPVVRRLSIHCQILKGTLGNEFDYSYKTNDANLTLEEILKDIITSFRIGRCYSDIALIGTSSDSDVVFFPLKTKIVDIDDRSKLTVMIFNQKDAKKYSSYDAEYLSYRGFAFSCATIVDHAAVLLDVDDGSFADKFRPTDSRGGHWKRILMQTRAASSGRGI